MSAIEPEDSDTVRAQQQGLNLTLAFGRRASWVRTYPAITALILASVIAAVVLIARFARPSLLDVAFFGMLFVLQFAITLAVLRWRGQPMMTQSMKRGQIEVTATTVETSLKYDPYTSKRAEGRATDTYPQFRRSIERGRVTSVTAVRSPIAVMWGRGHEVRVSTRRGTEYVLSTHLTKDQATEIGNRLRQHLELATDPYFSPRVVD